MRREDSSADAIVFLIDRSLGRKYVVEALRAAGAQVEALDDHFPQNAPDTEWLATAGQRGWIVLSKDLRMNRDALERHIIIEAAVRAFILTRQDLTGTEMAKLFADALPAMKRHIERVTRPFVFSISRSGQFKRLA